LSSPVPKIPQNRSCHEQRRSPRGNVIIRDGTTRGATAEDSKILWSAILHAPLTVFRDLEQWQYPMVDHDCMIISNKIGLFKVRASTDDLKHILQGQEPSVEAAIRTLVKPGDTFVDAGANIGFYTVLSSKLVGEKGRVVSFEMVPQTATILRCHVMQNGCSNVKVIEGALAEISGLTVYASLVDGKSGQSSIRSGDSRSKVAVETITLHDQLKDIENVNLMKMDIEGAELLALKGLSPDLQKVQAIIFENRGAMDVVHYLQAHGFTISRLDGNNALARQGV